MYCLNLMRIALELAIDNPAYVGLAVKFFEHFVYIGAALNRAATTARPSSGTTRTASSTTSSIWPDGIRHRFRVRSLVGLIPLFGDRAASTTRWLDPVSPSSGRVSCG